MKISGPQGSLTLAHWLSRHAGPGQVVIRRRPLLYVVSLLIPSFFLMLVDLGSFYLPPSCRARIVFKTSVLVGYTVFRVNMADEMPRSAGSTPLIGEHPQGAEATPVPAPPAHGCDVAFLGWGDRPQDLTPPTPPPLFLPTGVFFTVCMALLVLSLSKSILLVRFLHDEHCSGWAQPLRCFQGHPETDGPPVDSGDHLAGVPGLWEALLMPPSPVFFPLNTGPPLVL